jgi:hypothetical protein
MLQPGIHAVSEEDLLSVTGYAGTKSTGYQKSMKELRDAAHIEKTQGSVSLTGEGISYVEENGLADATVAAVTTENHQARLKDHLVQKANAPEAKVLSIWNILLDGQYHDTNELLRVTGYKSTKSTGYCEVMKWLKKLDLLEKNAKGFRFTDKVYQHSSRPKK